MSNPSEAQLSRQEQIFATALRLFVKQGLQATSMAQISKESKVAVGTIYLHFKSKDKLIQALYTAVNESFGEAIHLDEVEMQGSIEARIKLICRKAYRYYSANPLQFNYHNSIIYSPFMNSELRNQIRENYRQAMNILQEGIDTGLIIDEAMILLLRWSYNGIISLVQIRNEVDVTPQMEDNLVDMLWKGLLK